MKRFFNTIMLLAIGCIASLADDKLYIPDFYMVPGEQKTVEIILDNETPISSLQFDMFFPEGLEYVDGSLAKVTERITRSSHSTMAVDNNGYIRFGVLSTAANPANSAIKGNSGAILTIDIKAGDNFNGGSILINNIIGSNATVAEPVRVDMASSTASVAIDPGHFALEDTLAEVCPNVPMLINVSLANNINLVGMQANVTLPEGVVFTNDENGEKITYGSRLSENVVANVEPIPGKPNTYIMLISSLTNDLFDGNSGVLFGLNIIADSANVDADVVIDNIKVATPAGQEYDIKDVLKYTVKSFPVAGQFTLEDTLAEVRPNVPMLINVALANNINLVSMQANVTLPNGVDFTKGENGEVVVLGDRLSENVTVSVIPVDGKENTFLLNISSPNKDLFKGNDGVLFGLNIIADGTNPDGDVVIGNIKVTTPAGQQYDLKDVLNYTVKCYTDPSGDGVVDIDDVINLHEVIKGVADNPYADVNSDGVVDIDDIYALYSLMKK